MTSLVVGVIGHVDHGKTALVKALTGEDTDRLAEEKARGISIALGFARLDLGSGQNIDLIDMPGHERFVRTMIAGATGIDAVLLVLAANEGIKPQTIEHIDIAGLLGLRRAVVAISKIDLVTPEQAARVAAESVELLKSAGMAVLPPVLTSVVQDRGMAELRQALVTLASGMETRTADGLAFLPIDRAFSIAGHGPVVTGTLRGASVNIGDRLELFPARKIVRVRAVQTHGVRAAAAAPGQRVALNLREVELAELSHGMALAAPETLAPSEFLSISIRAVKTAPPLKNGMRLRALLGTQEVDIRLRLLDRDVLEAGEDGFAQLRCAGAVAIPAREHVVLRLASPSRTVAGGVILEPETARLRRNFAPALARLKNLSELPAIKMLAAEVEAQGLAGTSLQKLSRLTGLAPARIAEFLRPFPVLVTRSGLAAWQADLDALSARIPALLARHAGGLGQEKLASAIPGAGPEMLEEAFARLLARKEIAKQGGNFLIPRPEEDRARTQSEGELAARIAQTLLAGGLSPPDPKEIITSLPAKRAVDRLIREGTVIRAVDRAKDKEILFHQDAVEQAKRVLAPLLEHAPGLLATEVGAALGISRKYTMPLLDHLDSIRFTRRINDRRINGTALSMT